jgi:hypothetical protein
MTQHNGEGSFDGSTPPGQDPWMPRRSAPPAAEPSPPAALLPGYRDFVAIARSDVPAGDRHPALHLAERADRHPALLLAERADRAAFSPAGSLVDEPWPELRRLRRMVRRGIPWYRRLTWPVDPRPLWRR